MNKLLKILIPLDIAKGLRLTGKHFARVFWAANRRKVPVHLVKEYPEVPVQVQPRFRGRLQMLREENGDPKCICCMSCERICPTGAIHILPGKKEGRKARIPLEYTFELERCIFCELCVESCGYDAILLNHQFELAAYNREDFAIGMGGRDQNLFEPSPVAKFSVAGEE